MNRKSTKTVRVDEKVELRENESDWVDRKLLENRVKKISAIMISYQEVLIIKGKPKKRNQ